MRNVFMMLMWSVLLVALARAQETPQPADKATLRQYADQMGFRVGAALSAPISRQDPQYARVLAREFNAAHSFVFMRFTQPERGQFNFRGMDKDMQFANDHRITLFGNALVYRCRQAAPWLSPGGRCGSGWSPNELDQILRDHIQTVVRHGGNTYYAWEVVNEPLANLADPWQRAFGREGYLAKAFRYAHEANPNALLVLNEAFGWDGVDRGRTDEFFELIKKLKSSGVPIDVAGIEMHLEAQLLRPTFAGEFRYFLARAREVRVQVHVTEMDVYQGPPGAFPDPFGRQTQIYHDVVSTCLQDPGCTAFYTWGISDAHNWLAQRPGNPLPDAKPLLFDEHYGKKPAYFAVLEALIASRRAGRR